MTRWWPLVCLAVLHFLVDTCAFLVEPLWGELKSAHALDETWLFAVLTLQAIAPNASQLVFGLFRDRAGAPFLLWVGPVTAAGCLTLVGLAPNVGALCAILLCGGIGVGAFHPEAAATAGELRPEERTRSVALFLLGGTLGLGFSPLLSGAVVQRFGLRGLAALGPVMLVAIGLAHAVVRRNAAPRAAGPVAAVPPLAERMRGMWGLAAAVWIVCSLRLVPNMAMTKVLALALSRQGESVAFIGGAQALFIFSGGAGMTWLAWRGRQGAERRTMIAASLLGIPCLLLLGRPGCPTWLLLTVLVPTGLVLWGTTPVHVALAHRLFPRATGLASAMTMGVSFGLAGVIQAGITSAFDAAGAAQSACLGFVPCLALAAIGAWLLPEPGREPASDVAAARDTGSANGVLRADGTPEALGAVAVGATSPPPVSGLVPVPGREG